MVSEKTMPENIGRNDEAAEIGVITMSGSEQSE
jgi:hypothetical protein